MKKITTAVILYDLIPLIHEEVYLSNPIVKDWYLKKIAQLKNRILFSPYLNHPGTKPLHI